MSNLQGGSRRRGPSSGPGAAVGLMGRQGHTWSCHQQSGTGRALISVVPDGNKAPKHPLLSLPQPRLNLDNSLNGGCPIQESKTN